jgi:hypothetical protein
MMRRDLVAYGLIGLGVLALLARVTGGAGWLWIALVAVALLATYASQRTYGLLLVGGLLAGTAVGILLQQAFPSCDGVFLVSLGAGLLAVDRVERREPRWPRTVGLALAALGLVLALTTSGILGSAWFALLLIAVGAAVLWRGRQATAFPPPIVTPPNAAPSGARPPSATSAAPEAQEPGAEATIPPSESR